MLPPCWRFIWYRGKLTSSPSTSPTRSQSTGSAPGFRRPSMYRRYCRGKYWLSRAGGISSRLRSRASIAR